LQAAKDVVLAPKPVIADDAAVLEPRLLRSLLAQLSSLAAVYHKAPEAFVSRQRLAVTKAAELVAPNWEEEEGGGGATSSGPRVSEGVCVWGGGGVSGSKRGNCRGGGQAYLFGAMGVQG
jgi:hypothetical protein